MNYYVYEYQTPQSKQISCHTTPRAAIEAAEKHSATVEQQVFAERHKRNPKHDRLEVVTVAIFERGKRIS